LGINEFTTSASSYKKGKHYQNLPLMMESAYQFASSFRGYQAGGIWKMNIPGYTAETSLYKIKGHYFGIRNIVAYGGTQKIQAQRIFRIPLTDIWCAEECYPIMIYDPITHTSHIQQTCVVDCDLSATA
jgi:hypothetical protein